MTPEYRNLVAALAAYAGPEVQPLTAADIDDVCLDTDESDPETEASYTCLLVQDSVSEPEVVEVWIAGEEAAEEMEIDVGTLIVREPRDEDDDSMCETPEEFTPIHDIVETPDACLFDMEALPVLIARYALANEDEEAQADGDVS